MISYKKENIYIENDGYYTLTIESSKHGMHEFKIDKEDFERCSQYHWSINKFKSNKIENGYFYAINTKVGLLHRFLTDAPKGMVVDHINGDTYDNRAENLKICTIKENVRKSRPPRNNTSGKLGVCYHKQTGKWLAHIMVDRKFKNLGYYEDIEDAANARINAEKMYYGEFIPIDREIVCINN